MIYDTTNIFDNNIGRYFNKFNPNKAGHLRVVFQG